MTYAIVYSSRTGNTKRLAETVRRDLEDETVLYCGELSEKALEADRIFIGFWTEQGTCDKQTEAFLKTVRRKEVFLFGTAGFGDDPNYFETILKRTRRHLHHSVTVLDTFMCCGKMPVSVRERYVKLMDSPSRPPHLEEMNANFDRAIFHPDAADLLSLQDKVLRCIQK